MHLISSNDGKQMVDHSQKTYRRNNSMISQRGKTGVNSLCTSRLSHPPWMAKRMAELRYLRNKTNKQQKGGPNQFCLLVYEPT